MPSRRIHEFVTEILLEKKFSDVHAALDGPASSSGPGHRRIFHDPETAVWIGYEVAGGEGAMAALLHVLTDEAWDKNTEEISNIYKILKNSKTSSDKERNSEDKWMKRYRKSFSGRAVPK